MATGERSVHPALVPGISVEDTNTKFPTRVGVFATALVVAMCFIVWAAVAPDNIADVGSTMQSWVVRNLGWLYGGITLGCIIFMLVIAYRPTGRIRLGPDDVEPEFSTLTWISMLFAAGLGIGLIFYGPMEPLQHFLHAPPATDAESGTMDAVLPGMSQAVLHQASFPWGIYALVGGALAYTTYRRGRVPLISAVFEPIFPDGSNRVLGKIIDVAAVLVTLFGTATSLGIGALQIRTGTSILTGEPLEGNGFVVVIMAVLTVIFIISAVSGIKRGIALLSNINMGLVITLGVFVLITGPTLFLLDLMPATILNLADNFMAMFQVSASQGEVAEEFLTSWTTLFWAWWISWSPFVGMFIAKISKGRTIREFATVVVLVPSAISTAWFVIFGGSAIKMNLEGLGVTIKESGENVMFDIMGNLPLTGLTSIVVIIAVVIFFVTAADSATVVMGSMSQSGRPEPSKPVTIIWGAALGLIAIFLLLAGGQDALSGLQSIMVACSLPFALIIIGMMVSWWKDLANDPETIRRRYARSALYKGIAKGIDEHGDDFVVGVDAVPAEEGAGAGFDSEDPALTDWYKDATSEDPEEARRQREEEAAATPDPWAAYSRTQENRAAAERAAQEDAGEKFTEPDQEPDQPRE
ncbi:BCCT family transporter [uncultured Corynebacterium sp.]|uniref:BCCT family transporter n=1 Tax=uncultured Corynebacterium sp. TaxID=159447 RepID=UPI0025D9225C|nr:BCCT family transporter [uncultured Corynebacterium sp.]